MKEKIVKKDLLIISSNPENSFAGDGRNAFLWAKELRERFKPIFMTLNFEGAYFEPQNTEEFEIVRISYYNRNLIQKLYSRVIFLLKFLRYLFKTEIVLVYGKVLGNKAIILLCRVFGKQLIFRSTLFGFDDMMSLSGSASSKRIYGLISGYHSISPAFTNSYKCTFGNDIKVFESCQGVKAGNYLPRKKEEKANLRKKFQLPFDLPIILSVGPLRGRKGISELFLCLNQLNWQFVFLVLGDHQVDDNHYLYKFKEEINQNIKTGRELLGEKLILRQEGVNMFEYYQLSDIYISNSYQEGVPNSLLEAMSTGLPSIVRRIPGLENFICFQNHNCIMFDDASEIPQIIQILIQDNGFYNKISENSAKFVESNLDIQIVTRDFVNHFNL